VFLGESEWTHYSDILFYSLTSIVFIEVNDIKITMVSIVLITVQRNKAKAHDAK
jgi:hypothetical protein